MKLTIERAALLKALAHVQSVVERRNTIPILSNVLITAQKGRLSLAATDMDLAITEQVEATARQHALPGARDRIAFGRHLSCLSWVGPRKAA